MKNISYFNILFANFCTFTMGTICAFSLSYITCPILTEYLGCKPQIPSVYIYVLIRLLLQVFAPVAIVVRLTIVAFNWIFKCDTGRTTKRYPKSYCIIKSEQSTLDRRNFVRTTTGYRKSYTLLLQLTYDELQAVLAEMQSNYSLCYAFPKSFPLPDCVTWYQPRIFLCTIRKLLRQMSPQSSAVLCYRHRLWRDNLDGVKRTKDHILVQANLHQKFCQEADIIIRSTLK